MLKNILTVLRKLTSAAMNFLIVYFETIAVPMSWAMGGTIMFTMYTELSNIFNGAVCLLVGLWQLGCIFTGRELPLWLKRLKFISTSCLAMTLLTVVIILAREFAVSGLRMVAAGAKDGKVIAANMWGKVKTVLQMLTIIFYYFTVSLTGNVLGQQCADIASVLCWVVAAVTAISGIKYLWDNRSFINTAK